jgi:AcrR family transcriptional regulator
MKTKERILDTATTLFNKQGTGAVSTNHIAEALGMSPGNLYYHFQNKQQIIEAIFERWYARTDVAFALDVQTPLDLNLIQALVHANFAILREYTFIYRELVALVLQTPSMHQRYLQIRQRGYEGFREIVTALNAVGILRGAESDEVATQLADVCWLISEFWLPNVELQGHTPDEAQLQRGVDLMMRVLDPYIVR